MSQCFTKVALRPLFWALRDLRSQHNHKGLSGTVPGIMLQPYYPTHGDCFSFFIIISVSSTAMNVSNLPLFDTSIGRLDEPRHPCGRRLWQEKSRVPQKPDFWMLYLALLDGLSMPSSLVPLVSLRSVPQSTLVPWIGIKAFWGPFSSRCVDLGVWTFLEMQFTNIMRHSGKTAATPFYFQK